MIPRGNTYDMGFAPMAALQGQTNGGLDMLQKLIQLQQMTEQPQLEQQFRNEQLSLRQQDQTNQLLGILGGQGQLPAEFLNYFIGQQVPQAPMLPANFGSLLTGVPNQTTQPQIDPEALARVSQVIGVTSAK